jgi:hypothetical protein
MEKYFIKLISVFCLLTFIVSCDRPICKNTNTIFDNFTPDRKEYKDELVKELEKIDKTKLTFWMENYQEIGKSQFIYVNIQGDGLCAKIVLTIESSKKGIEGILKNKGDGYIGAELENLKFEIRKDSMLTEFVFKEIIAIVD